VPVKIMASSKPVCRDPNDRAVLVLNQALGLEIAGSLSRKSLAGSLLIHAALCLSVYLPAYRGHRKEPIVIKTVLTQVFVPSPAMPEASAEAVPGKLDTVALETPAADSLVAVDLSAIHLSFLADVRNQLPAVVGAQGGVLALLDKDNRAIARYIFRPPDWRAEETTTDVTGKLRIRMDPPQKWPVFREIAARDGLDLDAFLACAIFDVSYRHCLQSAIRSRIPAAFAGHVSAASLAFRADRPCGVEVLDVSLAADPTQLTGK